MTIEQRRNIIVALELLRGIQPGPGYGSREWEAIQCLECVLQLDGIDPRVLSLEEVE